MKHEINFYIPGAGQCYAWLSFSQFVELMRARGCKSSVRSLASAFVSLSYDNNLYFDLEIFCVFALTA